MQTRIQAALAAGVTLLFVALALATGEWFFRNFAVLCLVLLTLSALGLWAFRVRLVRVTERLAGGPVVPWGRALQHDLEVRSVGPLRWLHAGVAFEVRAAERSLPDQPPGIADSGRTHRYHMVVPCKRRGRWTLGPIWAGVDAGPIPIFGERWTEISPARAILVLARWVRLSGSALTLEGIRPGDGAGRRRGDEPPDIDTVRDYVSGDPMTAVNWKLSAHVGHLMTTTYESEPPVQVNVTLVLDLDAGSGTEDAAELLVTIAASYCVLLAGGHRGGRSIGLVASGTQPVHVPASSGHGRGARRLQTILAEVGSGDRQLLIDALRPFLRRAGRRRGQDIALLITARPPQERAALIARLRSAGVAVRVVQVETAEAGHHPALRWQVPALHVPLELDDPRREAELAAVLSGAAAPKPALAS